MNKEEIIREEIEKNPLHMEFEMGRKDYNKGEYPSPDMEENEYLVTFYVVLEDGEMYGFESLFRKESEEHIRDKMRKAKNRMENILWKNLVMDRVVEEEEQVEQFIHEGTLGVKND